MVPVNRDEELYDLLDGNSVPLGNPIHTIIGQVCDAWDELGERDDVLESVSGLRAEFDQVYAAYMDGQSSMHDAEQGL